MLFRSGIASGASIYIQNQKGSKTVSSVGHVLTYDQRNSRITPTEGYVLRMNNDVAGLAGDVHYTRNVLSGAYHYTVTDGWILNMKARGGIIMGLGEDVGLLDRFFIGGDTMRGFSDSGVGPRDKVTHDALGGEVVYNGSAELVVPLGLPKELGISGKVFTDAGSVTGVNPAGVNVADSASIRASAGVGVTWVSPIGPISLDFGQALIKESYDQTEVMRVNFGTKF